MGIPRRGNSAKKKTTKKKVSKKAAPKKKVAKKATSKTAKTSTKKMAPTDKETILAISTTVVALVKAVGDMHKDIKKLLKQDTSVESSETTTEQNTGASAGGLFDSAPAETTSQYTLEDVKQGLQEVSAKHGMEKCKEIVTKHGAERVSDIAQEKYADVMKDIQATTTPPPQTESAPSSTSLFD